MSPAEADLAARTGRSGNKHIQLDPFASPASAASKSPTQPQPCAQPPLSARSSRAAVASSDSRPTHDRPQHYHADKSHKTESMSSAEDSAVMTPMSSIDLEKQGFTREQTPKRPSRESKRSKESRGTKGSKERRDPEKAVHHSRNDSHHPPHQGGNSAVTYPDNDTDDGIDEGRELQEEKAVNVLFFLSGPCVFVSAMNTVWTLIALVITCLSQPIRLCARRPSFGQQLAGLLGPTLNLQLRCIYTPLPPYANEDSSYHSFMLVLVHILSPFLSFVVMFAAWVLAVYWVSSTIVGDPAGQDKRDDGKETVLGLRNFWERWLMRGMKEE